MTRPQTDMADDNKLIAQRREKLANCGLRATPFQRLPARPLAADLHARYGHLPAEDLEAQGCGRAWAGAS